MKTITFKQVIKIILPILLLVISLSCKGDSKQKTEIEDQDSPKTEVEKKSETETTPEIVTEEKTEAETAREIEIEEKAEEVIPASTNNEIALELGLSDTVQNFILCKSNATERSDCRNVITKVISEAHGLSEFKDSNQKYVIYDSIQPIVKKSSQWQNIGSATNQEVLNKALEHTNNGGLSLVIDTSETYGHVVMVVTGEAKNSGSWELKLPPVLSLLNYKSEQSFHNKSLAYALKKSDDLQVYIRN